MSAPTLSRILYAEDEPDIQTVAKLALEIVGHFHVTLCSSGHEALRVAGANPPDLILLDVMMPEMDGPTTLAALRRDPKTAHIPVVFMTAKAQLQEVALYKSLGALDVITKPFDPMNLASQVRRIWEAHHSGGEQGR